jgi:hypothetical protein
VDPATCSHDDAAGRHSKRVKHAKEEGQMPDAEPCAKWQRAEVAADCAAECSVAYRFPDRAAEAAARAGRIELAGCRIP